MSTSFYPYTDPLLLKKAEEDSLARELNWLLDSLQDSLAALKSGLEECYALLAPIEPGSTLVLSSPRSESIKGHVTRVGTRIVKGTLHLRLRTLPSSSHPLTFSLSAEHPLILTPLSSLRTLLNQSLDCVDIARWTGDRHSASFISSQFLLLHSLLREALELLKGPSPPSTPTSATGAVASVIRTEGRVVKEKDRSWTHSPPPDATFTPPLPPNLSLSLVPTPSSTLLLTLRVLEPTSLQPNLGSRFALAIGAQRRLEHDEMDDIFMYKGEEVRVREKVRCESAADPVMLVLCAKMGALERTVAERREALGIVMGGGIKAEVGE